ncbi:MAG: multi-sensor hybrid histidine kinase [Verrucomicrobia bacterium]|nr:multi-sensor hybrid histidine kinase [Verrucomicrobiota bacterium]
MNLFHRFRSVFDFLARKVSIERKWRLGFSSVLAGLALIAALSARSVLTMQRTAESTRHSEEVISTLRLLRSHVTDAESAQRAYELTGHESYLAAYALTPDRIATDIKALRVLIEDNAAQQRRLDAMQSLIATRVARLSEEIEFRRTHGVRRPETVGTNSVLARDWLRELSEEMETEESTLLSARAASAKKSATQTMIVIGSSSIAALVLVSLSLLAVWRDAARRRDHELQLTLAGQLARMGGWSMSLPEFRETWSEQVCSIFQVPPGFVPAPNASRAFYAPESREAVAEAFRRCAREGTPFDLEARLLIKDCETWVRLIGSARRNSKGTIKGIQGALQDITERKGLDDDVRRLAAIVKDSADAIVSVSLDGMVTSWNPSAELMFGYAASEIIGQPSARITPHDHEQKNAESIAGFHPDHVRHFDTESVRKNGERFPVAVTMSPIKNPKGEIVGLSKIFRDVTERSRSLAALHESETRFRELAENIDEVFWVTDAAHVQTLYLSPAYEKIWGQTCQSAYDSPGRWFEAIRPEDRARVERAAEAMQTTWDYDVEYRIVRPDGTQRWIRDRAFPVRDPDGKIKRWVGVAGDLTEYRTMQEHLRQAQKMEAVGTLAGGIAHDFNNILSVIVGFTGLAQLRVTNDPALKEYLTGVLQAADRATGLVRQILTFSRQQKVERSPIALQSVLAEAMKLLRATIPSSVEFTSSLEDDAPVVLADSGQIHQILMNLGTNAWHALQGDAGRIELRLERWVVTAESASEPKLAPGVYARVSVADTGCGMDETTQRRMFEPFFTTKPVGEGTGLGLAVVHGIMDSHDGAIGLESRIGEGTTFHLYFPEYIGEAAIVAPIVPRLMMGHGEKILVVDDEDLLLQVLVTAVTALGYAVESTPSPAAALAKIREDPPQFALVLTDQTMPGMSGLLLAGEIRKIRADLPVILMTGYSLALPPERVEAAGIRRLLLKPATLETLGTALAEVLAAPPPDSPAKV